jgi:hypothetical protein
MASSAMNPDAKIIAAKTTKNALLFISAPPPLSVDQRGAPEIDGEIFWLGSRCSN